jgi:hypothetical protein
MNKALLLGAAALAFSAASAGVAWADGADDYGYAAPVPAVPAPPVYAAPVYTAPQIYVVPAPVYAAPVVTAPIVTPHVVPTKKVSRPVRRY